MKIFMFFYLASVIFACKVEQHSEEKTWGKFGKLAKTSDDISKVAKHIDELLKGGKKENYDELIQMLKNGSKHGDTAVRAFRQLVEKPVAELDAAFVDLKKASELEGVFAVEAQKLARDNVDAKMTVLVEASVQHDKTVEKIYSMSINQREFLRDRMMRFEGDDVIDRHKVSPILKSGTVDRWMKTVATHYPEAYDKLKGVRLKVMKVADNKLNREVWLGLATVVATGVFSEELRQVGDYILEKYSGDRR